MVTLFSSSKTCAVLALAVAAGIAFASHPAAAEKNKKKNDSSSYWSISFLGGELFPRRDMRSTHDAGLAAGGRVGWTSSMGLGLYLAVDYAPLARNATSDPLESFETHFGLVTVQPSYTLSWKSLRLWVAGGVGMAAERTRRFYRDVAGERRTDYSPAASAVSGLELHLFNGGGLVVTASYSRLFKAVGFTDVKYEFVNLTGGFVFAFR